MQVYICDECSDGFDEPFFQLTTDGNVEHLHKACLGLRFNEIVANANGDWQGYLTVQKLIPPSKEMAEE